MDTLEAIEDMLEKRDKRERDLVYAAPEERPLKKAIIRKFMQRVVYLMGQVKWVESDASN